MWFEINVRQSKGLALLLFTCPKVVNSPKDVGWIIFCRAHVLWKLELVEDSLLDSKILLELDDIKSQVGFKVRIWLFHHSYLLCIFLLKLYRSSPLWYNPIQLSTIKMQSYGIRYVGYCIFKPVILNWQFLWLVSWSDSVAISRYITRHGSHSNYICFTRKMLDLLILKLIFSLLDCMHNLSMITCTKLTI